jgi:hypothetical protein
VHDLHVNWAWFVIFSNAIAGLWALGAHRWESLRTRALWWFVGLAEITMFVQVGLGVWLVSKEKFVATKFHMLYGFVGIITVGILYSYKFQMRHKLYLLYGFGSLFIMGLGIRAMLVGKA